VPANRPESEIPPVTVKPDPNALTLATIPLELKLLIFNRLAFIYILRLRGVCGALRDIIGRLPELWSITPLVYTSKMQNEDFAFFMKHTQGNLLHLRLVDAKKYRLLT
jgi:F-box domain